MHLYIRSTRCLGIADVVVIAAWIRVEIAVVVSTHRWRTSRMYRTSSLRSESTADVCIGAAEAVHDSVPIFDVFVWVPNRVVILCLYHILCSHTFSSWSACPDAVLLCCFRICRCECRTVHADVGCATLCQAFASVLVLAIWFDESVCVRAMCCNLFSCHLCCTRCYLLSRRKGFPLFSTPTPFLSEIIFLIVNVYIWWLTVTAADKLRIQLYQKSGMVRNIFIEFDG